MLKAIRLFAGIALLITATASAETTVKRDDKEKITLVTTKTEVDGKNKPAFIFSLGIQDTGKTVSIDDSVATAIVVQGKVAGCGQIFFVAGDAQKLFPITGRETYGDTATRLHIGNVRLGDVRFIATSIEKASIQTCDKTHKLGKQYAKDFNEFLDAVNKAAAQ
ncbi:MAG: hypothetical protein LBE75_02980 [Burkholderiales bacterium]|jgi:hypothetical protein|nr:hypothetical protein [Burkholderiales bacterium]